MIRSCASPLLGFDFPQHWSELDTTGGPRPPPRCSPACCCIAGPLTGQEHPVLLVEGGDASVDGLWSAYDDMWVLDIDKGVWNEVS